MALHAVTTTALLASITVMEPSAVLSCGMLRPYFSSPVTCVGLQPHNSSAHSAPSHDTPSLPLQSDMSVPSAVPSPLFTPFPHTHLAPGNPNQISVGVCVAQGVLQQAKAALENPRLVGEPQLRDPSASTAVENISPNHGFDMGAVRSPQTGCISTAVNRLLCIM